MPHSGGGGSSSSGSHHSSSSHSSSSHHSGGGGSSSSGARYSQKPRSYHTAYRSHDDDVYVRYRNGTPQFRYVGKKEYRKCSKKFIILTSLLPAVLFPLLLGILIYALTGASIFSGRVRKPSPVTESYADAQWNMIDDRADSFTPTEEQQIAATLRSLYQTSGIRTEIQTITENMFLEADKSDLETYAYAEYVNLFSDEDHLLIVFEDIGDDDWKFELMEGDNTSDWLNDGVNDHFDDKLTENLWATSRYTYGTAFVASLQDLNLYMTEHAGEPTWEDNLNTQVLRFILAVTLYFSLFWGLVRMKSLLSDGSAEKQMEEAGYQKLNHPVMVINSSAKAEPKMVKCDYCNGVYPYGMMSCPHCGAPAKASIK